MIAAAALATAFASFQPVTTQAQYTATAIGTLPGDSWAYASAINAAGHVVGDSYGNAGSTAFLWQNGVMTNLGTLGGTNSSASTINDSGQVIGYSDTASGEWHAFLWQSGVMTDLGTLGGVYSSADAINAAGQVIGSSLTASGEGHAFLWQNGVMTDLGTLGGVDSSAYALNDAGQVIGWSYTGSGEYHAFLWQNGVMSDLGTLGGANSWAYAINNVGQVVGGSLITNNQEYHAFFWQNGVMSDLGTIGANSYSEAYDINDFGQVVGWSDGSCTLPDGTDLYDYHAVLWENSAIQDLGNVGCGHATYAIDINNAGQIVGEIDDVDCGCAAGAFLYSGGVMTDLNNLTPGLGFSHADGINDCEQIVADSFWTQYPYRLDRIRMGPPPLTSAWPRQPSCLASPWIGTSSGRGIR